MLILTRRIGETLRIGDDVSLMVLGVQGNQVRIGADAPKDIAIHREEIYRRIQAEKNGTPPPPKEKKYSSKPKYDSPASNDNYIPTPAPMRSPMVNGNIAEPQEGTRYYSTEGNSEGNKAKKKPTVIVKKKRVIENV